MSTTTRARRPQLSEQIDRLDALLDGLADGLNEAIADAATAGARAAVREVLAGLLADPAFLDALRPRPVPPEIVEERTPDSPPPAKPKLAARLRLVVGRGAAAMFRGVRSTVAAVVRAARPAVFVADVLRVAGLRRTVAIAVAAGVAASGLTLIGPAWLAAVVAGLTGATTAAAVRLAVVVRAAMTQVPFE